MKERGEKFKTIVAYILYFSNINGRIFFFAKEEEAPFRKISFDVKAWKHDVEPIIGEVIYLSDVRNRYDNNKKKVWFANSACIFHGGKSERRLKVFLGDKKVEINGFNINLVIYSAGLLYVVYISYAIWICFQVS